jgi:flagellin-like protein
MWINILCSYELNIEIRLLVQVKGVGIGGVKNYFEIEEGHSPILATLLLIVIVVAAIVVAYMWVMTYMGNTTQQAGVLLYKANVNFVSGNIVVDVGNSGTSDTTIIGV